jgi:hypothetical protein
MGKESKPEYPFIEVAGKDDLFEKGYGKGGKPLPQGGITESDFRNKLNLVLTTDDIKSKFMGKYFFELDLRVDYFLPLPQELFHQLGVEVKSVFPSKDGLRKVIVSGDHNTIEKYRSKSTVNKQFLLCISDIRRIESDKKIGESIKNNWATKTNIKVDVSFLQKPTNEEIDTLEQNIPGIKKELNFGKHTSTASGVLTKEKIEKLSEIPIVKRISEPAKWKASFIVRAAGQPLSFKIEEPENINALPAVCVIDTGISKDLGKFAQTSSVSNLEPWDNNGHGTAVASLCMFNKSELSGSNIITPSIRIVSKKIAEHSESNDLNLFEEIINTLDEHKDKTKIFCLSWNCISYDEITYEDRLKELDGYLQKNNILLVNSAGNLERHEVVPMIQKYPTYLLENPVMTPSESKYTISVGSTYKQGQTKTQLSPFTRVLLPMNAVNRVNEEIDDRFVRIKPEIFAEGGSIVYGSNSDNDKLIGVMCLDHNCKRDITIGTSLSAPQVARAAALLEKQYDIKNMETLKALLFLKSASFVHSDDTKNFAYHGKMLSEEISVLDADDGFYLFFEGETQANERIRDIKKDKVHAKSWAFPVPKEIESVEFAICHSNNSPFEDLRTFSTRIVTSIHKPGCKNPLNKNADGGFGTMGHRAPLIFGKYKYTRSSQEGLWKIKAYVETAGIPQAVMNKISVRYGVAIKLNLKQDALNDKKNVYSKIVQMLKKNTEVQEPISEETQIQSDVTKQSIPGEATPSTGQV